MYMNMYVYKDEAHKREERNIPENLKAIRSGGGGGDVVYKKSSHEKLIMQND